MTEVGGLPLDVTATPDAHAMNTGTDLDSVALNVDPITTAIGVVAAMTLIEVAPDHSTDLPIATSHVIEAPVPTTLDTPHHKPLSHRNTSRDDSRSQHRSKKHHYKSDRGSSSTSQTPSWRHKDKRHKQVTIDDLPSEYYSSDDNDSDSDEDLN